MWSIIIILTNTVSSAWQDEHLKFLGGFIIVLFLRDNDVLINMIYDVGPYRKETKLCYMLVY